jgi:hypothetical protein
MNAISRFFDDNGVWLRSRKITTRQHPLEKTRKPSEWLVGAVTMAVPLNALYNNVAKRWTNNRKGKTIRVVKEPEWPANLITVVLFKVGAFFLLRWCTPSRGQESTRIDRPGMAVPIAKVT